MIFHDAAGVTLHLGDCVEVMRALPDVSVDAVVTDPPYGIGFMGREWDTFSPEAVETLARRRDRKGTPRTSDSRWASKSGTTQGGGVQVSYDETANGNRKFQAWCEVWAREAYRVLKPGGHLAAFGGPRTYHRLASGIEDAGFEVRDSAMWLFGSGFPKSLDVYLAFRAPRATGRLNVYARASRVSAAVYPRTTTREQWRAFSSWARRAGTALKPAYEPIVLARKPLQGTVAANVLAHGTGAINVDGCRIEGAIGAGYATPGTGQVGSGGVYEGGYRGTWESADPHPHSVRHHVAARWPPNVLLDEEAAAILDAEVGVLPSVAPSGVFASGQPAGWSGGTNNIGRTGDATRDVFGYGDRGGPSRFFYTAKASRSEREAGLEHLAPRRRSDAETRDADAPGSNNPRLRVNARRNDHPTVKPVDLMAWLCRLVTPPGGVILDPFNGSGTTGMGALDGGFTYIGIDREEHYLAIARERITHRHLTAIQPVAPTAETPAGRLL